MSADDETPRLDDLVTHKDLAAFLDMTERSLSGYRIPAVVMGGRRFYFKQAVARWLLRREGKGRLNPDR